MTISVVQSVKIADAWSGSFASNVTPGNTIFLIATDYNVVTATMSATAPKYNGSSVTGATLLKDVNSGSTTPVYTAIWMLPNVSGAAKTIAVTMNNGIGSSPTAGAVGLIGIEVAGLGASPALDKSNTGAATSGTAVTSAASGNITTTPEFILASLVIFGQSMSPVGGAWTELQFSDDFSLCGYQVVTSGSASYTYNQTGAGSAAWCGAIVTVKGTSSAHTATASLTVTPSFSATAAHVTGRSASLTVTPVLSAPPGADATASLTVTPVLSAAAAAGASASLTVTPVLSAADTAVHRASASLTVTPAFSATRSGRYARSASLTVTPALSAARTGKHPRTASLTITPVLLAAAALSAGGEPGYPDGPLGAVLEFLVNGTWTDVTRQAMPDGRQAGQLTGGQPDGAQQPNPGSLPVQLDNGDYRFSPRNASGPYYPYLRQNTPARLSFNSPYGHYLRMEADNSDRASVSDNSTLHVTGSLELRIGAILSDWQGCMLAARRDGTTGSWHWILNSDGTLTFLWWDSGGSTHTVTSPTAASVSWRAFRVTLDVSDGNVQFYVSTGIDGTWTSMGAAASGTSGAATSVRAGNCPLVVGYSSTFGSQLLGQVYGFRLYNGIGGTVAADAAFSAQSPGAASWTDSASNTWNLAGGAELTNRDYRLHGELASIAPTAAGMAARMQTVVAGRMRRLQQGKQPTVESPLRRAVRTQAGSLAPAVYIPMEDGGVSGGTSFGPVTGGNSLTASSGAATPAADTSFEASAALPLLNGAVLAVTVPSYSGATAQVVRFVTKAGALPAPATTQVLASVAFGSGTVRRLDMVLDSGGDCGLAAYNSGGGSVFTTSLFAGYNPTTPHWWSIEVTPSGGTWQYNLVNVAPGASVGQQLGGTVPTVSGTPGNVTSVTVNPSGFFTDTVFGHLQVQKAWTTMFALGAPLNAWRGELAVPRFARVCGEQNIPCRILGRPSVTQAMGAQPRGNPWVILQDCANAEQGIIYEPRDVLGLGLRTAESLGTQSAALTLSFAAAANLRGDLQPSDDDIGLCNDVSASTTDGAMFQVVLNDASPRSISEPKDGGAGDYTGSPVFNLAAASQLPAAAALYLAVHSADEPRYRNVACDLGIPGAPAADIARVRPGDLIVITDVPEAYQTADIQQLAMGWKEPFGPGRAVLLDCVPASPYS